MNIIEFMQSLPDFGMMSNNELEILESAMVIRDVADGHVFIHEGKKGHDMHLLLAGKVNVTHQSAAEHGIHVLEELHPGDLFGLHTCITNNKSLETYTADGPVSTAALPQQAFNMLYEADSPLKHHFQHVVAHQLARDYRTILRVLRKVMFSGGEVETVKKLESLIWKYKKEG